MSQTIDTRIQQLREEMQKRNIAVYVVPTSDFHNSEYVGDHFKAREFITGFTGSAGIAVITMEEANLWTDGRYFLQAEDQLKDSCVILRKMGEEGVPTIREYIKNTLKENEVIGFDGRVIDANTGNAFAAIASEKNGKLKVDEDLVGKIWTDRPELSKAPVWILEEKYSGMSTKDKLAKVREAMAEKEANVHLLTSLYDIAWLLNVRGDDIACVPVVLSYLALTAESCIWFVQEEALDEKVKAYLRENDIETRPYDDFYAYVEALREKTVLLNRDNANYRTNTSIDDSVKVISELEPTTTLKAVKNETELSNDRKAHLKDGIAVTKFIYWLKKNIGKIPMTEISASDYLLSLREQQEGFLGISFDTISGYAAHGAIVHYEATPETDIPLEPKSFLLVDSGGHYLEGTTDITRTIALGELTAEEKEMYTRCMRSHMNLANAKFLYGCSGINLDILARAPFWEIGMDYNHGTGHGVGHILNVHEGPNAFRWRTSPGRHEDSCLEAGMITTDEPGIYLEGKFGIRLENELVCQKDEKNAYGQFMSFESITYVPFDLDAIDKAQMNEREIGYLNAYHKMVYDKLAPYFEGDELAWLKEATRSI
ncbi:MAG: aminopeptidase P family protein [Agathobacter sp.]|uniref:aminopeptidase P family protein n=1 Tax=Agathobacter sp. TaxID=2021311 RepID=UPI00258B38CD|nr:aminopeptidase P family protein [Agathobacter sp.]MCR5676622.1 aminopeptidase P family protein [Agathobacter sp.]